VYLQDQYPSGKRFALVVNMVNKRSGTEKDEKDLAKVLKESGCETYVLMKHERTHKVSRTI